MLPTEYFLTHLKNGSWLEMNACSTPRPPIQPRILEVLEEVGPLNANKLSLILKTNGTSIMNHLLLLEDQAKVKRIEKHLRGRIEMDWVIRR